tara:strand:- start:496 stop:1608 length:1113 start_codon:yes stop_codon:yes gene_type:complete
MKRMKIVINIILITVFLFISLNFTLGWIWEVRTNLKFKNFKPYDDVVLKALNLSQEDGLTLYLETFIDRKFDYDQFTEHAENSGYENKFVNVTPELGRKTISPKNCKKNIFFYGGSTTFGYNVTDEQTIPSYLGKTLLKNKQEICIKNFGRGSYFSTQENILFQKHILNKKIKSGDIIIFLDGINENGNRNSRNTGFLFEVNKAINQDYWDMYKFTFPIFFDSLAINQFIKRIQKKYNLQKKSKLAQTNVFTLNDNLKHVFEKNILIRDGICKKLNLYCYSFLQPFATIHGKYFEKPTQGAIETRVLNIGENKKIKEKYRLLSETKNIINITNALDDTASLSYVDGVHYSPLANEEISNKIYTIILDKLN